MAWLVAAGALIFLIWRAAGGGSVNADTHPAVKASLVWNQVAVIVAAVGGGIAIAVAGVVQSDWRLVGLGAVVGAVGAAVATLQYLAYFSRRK